MVYASGAILVPIALRRGSPRGSARPRDRSELAFCGLLLPLGTLMLLEAALFATDTGAFQERYLLALGPLIPILFFVGARRLPGRRALLAVVGIGVVLIVIAFRAPLAGFTSGTGAQDSPTLQALAELEGRIGIANASLAVSLLAVAFVSFGVLAAWRPRNGVPAAALAALALVATIAVGAVARDVERTRSALLLGPTDLRWVDRHRLGDVPIVVTPGVGRVRCPARCTGTRA